MSLISDYPYICDVRRLARRRKVAVYLVGGFVRDLLLGRDCIDFDFAVEHHAIGLAKAFAKSIRGAFILLDEEHGCARVAKKEQGSIFTYDFADFRGETFKDDLKHRDFTINALSINTASLENGVELTSIIEKAVKGKTDLKNGIIRMASRKAFEEDPLRL